MIPSHSDQAFSKSSIKAAGFAVRIRPEFTPQPSCHPQTTMHAIAVAQLMYWVAKDPMILFYARSFIPSSVLSTRLLDLPDPRIAFSSAVNSVTRIVLRYLPAADIPTPSPSRSTNVYLPPTPTVSLPPSGNAPANAFVLIGIVAGLVGATCLLLWSKWTRNVSSFTSPFIRL
jgi:hypothetical protein